MACSFDRSQVLFRKWRQIKCIVFLVTFFLHLYSNFTCNTETTWVMRINWKATIIKLLTLIPIYTHSLLTDINRHKLLNIWKSYVNCGEIDKYGSDFRNIEEYLSSSEIKAWKKSEYLNKVTDVYHNNYLMQCLKLIYVDGNRSIIHQR